MPRQSPVAAEGVYCAPLPVLSIAELDGPPVPVAPNCHQAVGTEVARAALDAARCVTGYGAATGSCGGWSTASGVYRAVGRPIAGKSGTTDDNRAAWFIGMTPGLTAAGFIGDPDYPFHAIGTANHDKPRESVSLMLREALAGTPLRGFTPPAPALVGKAGKPTPKKFR